MDTVTWQWRTITPESGKHLTVTNDTCCSFVSAVVYICGPLDTFLSIMKLFESEIQDPENYAIFYLDVFAESLANRKPWQNSDSDWADPIKVFKVRRTQNRVIKADLNNPFICLDHYSCWDCVHILCRFIRRGFLLFNQLWNWMQELKQSPNRHLASEIHVCDI